jgi:hypothetical protein
MKAWGKLLDPSGSSGVSVLPCLNQYSFPVRESQVVHGVNVFRFAFWVIPASAGLKLWASLSMARPYLAVTAPSDTL